MGYELGAKIAQILKSLNMTQKELAIRINVSEGVVSRYIKGTRDPKPEIIANIATALNTTSDYLLGIEADGYDHRKVKRMLARNSGNMSMEEKRELMNALFGED